MTTKLMRPCDRCGYWHTLSNGFWRHLRPEVACKYVETARPASMDAVGPVYDAISRLSEAIECDLCGEFYDNVLLDDNLLCPECKAYIEAGRIQPPMAEDGGVER